MCAKAGNHTMPPVLSVNGQTRASQRFLHRLSPADVLPATFSDAAGALNECCNGRRAHEAAYNTGQAIHAERKGLPGKLLLCIHEACKEVSDLSARFTRRPETLLYSSNAAIST